MAIKVMDNLRFGPDGKAGHGTINKDYALVSGLVPPAWSSLMWFFFPSNVEAHPRIQLLIRFMAMCSLVKSLSSDTTSLSQLSEVSNKIRNRFRTFNQTRNTLRT